MFATHIYIYIERGNCHISVAGDCVQFNTIFSSITIEAHLSCWVEIDLFINHWYKHLHKKFGINENFRKKVCILLVLINLCKLTHKKTNVNFDWLPYNCDESQLVFIQIMLKCYVFVFIYTQKANEYFLDTIFPSFTSTELVKVHWLVEISEHCLDKFFIYLKNIGFLICDVHGVHEHPVYVYVNSFISKCNKCHFQTFTHSVKSFFSGTQIHL